MMTMQLNPTHLTYSRVAVGNTLCQMQEFSPINQYCKTSKNYQKYWKLEKKNILEFLNKKWKFSTVCSPVVALDA